MQETLNGTYSVCFREERLLLRVKREQQLMLALMLAFVLALAAEVDGASGSQASSVHSSRQVGPWARVWVTQTGRNVRHALPNAHINVHYKYTRTEVQNCSFILDSFNAASYFFFELTLSSLIIMAAGGLRGSPVLNYDFARVTRPLWC